MKNVSEKFIKEITSYGRMLDTIITYTINGKEYFLDSDTLFSVTPHFEGNILKSVMKQLDIESSVAIPKDTVINVKFGVQVDLSLTVAEVHAMKVNRLNEIPVNLLSSGLKGFEYIDLGNYIVSKDAEYNADTMSYSHTCYDKMLSSMKDYEDMKITFPIKVKDYIKKLCDYIGLTFASYNDNFANCDKELTADYYTGYDYTFRDVLDELAQVTASTICINSNDELEIRYIPKKSAIELNEDYFKDTNVTFDNLYGPINSIVLSRSGESDNIYLQDEESIENNGLCELKIIDNQIMNYNDRSDYLPAILEKLNGLTYCTNNFDSRGICFLDLCDRYTANVHGKLYDCVLFNDEIKITQGLEETIYTEMPTETKTDYTKADKTDQKINKAYIIMDKVNKKLESVISEVDETSKKVTKIEQTVDSISQKVSDIEDLTRTAEGIKTVTLENCIEANLLELHIYGNNTVFNYLLLDDKLTLDDNLHLEGDDLISVTDKDNNIKIYSLGITEALRQNSEVCDEVVLENGQAKVIRRVNKSGSTKAKESVEDLGKLEIPLKEGTNTITINNYTARIKAKYVIKSTYSDTFATKVEMNSEIKQTKESVDLSVNKKLEDYSTTTEMNSAISLKAGEITSSVSKTYETKENVTKQYSNIKQTTDNITSVVGKKVGNDEIISKINQSAESVSIDAKKININGTVSANGNFLVDTDGNMKAKNGIFSGNIDIGENNYLRSKDSKGNILMQIDKNGTDYYFNNVHVGKIGTDGIETDSSRRGLLIAIDKDAYFLGLGKNDDDGVTQPIYTWYNVSTGDNGTYAANTQGRVQIGNANWGFLVSIFKKLLVHGNVYAESFVNTSLESQKKNFEKLTLEEAIDILNNTDIYKYNLKSQDDIKKKHIGFVIGDNFNYSSKITSEDNDGVDNYSMTSVLYPIVKEQQAQIEELKKEIETLKGEKND
jgi:hypothetical protein